MVTKIDELQIEVRAIVDRAIADLRRVQAITQSIQKIAQISIDTRQLSDSLSKLRTQITDKKINVRVNAMIGKALEDLTKVQATIDSVKRNVGVDVETKTTRITEDIVRRKTIEPNVVFPKKDVQVQVNALVDKAIDELNRLKNVIESIPKTVDITAKAKITSETKAAKSQTGVLDRFTSGMRQGVFGTLPGGGGEEGALGGGISGMLGTMAGTLALSLGVLKIISSGVSDSAKFLGQASPALRSTLGLFQQAFMIFFRPFGDFLAQMLRPLAVTLMKMALGFNRWFGAQPNILKGAAAGGMGGALGGAAAGAIIGSIVPGLGTAIGAAMGAAIGGAGGAELGGLSQVNWKGIHETLQKQLEPLTKIQTTLENFSTLFYRTFIIFFRPFGNIMPKFTDFVNKQVKWLDQQLAAIGKAISGVVKGAANAVSGALAVAGKEVKSIWDFLVITWDKISKSVWTFFTVTLPQALHSVWEFLTIRFDAAVKNIWDFFTITLPKMGHSIWEFLTVTFPNFLKGIWTFLTIRWDMFTESIWKFLTITFPLQLKSIWDFLTVQFPTITKSIWDFLSISFSTISRNIAVASHQTGTPYIPQTGLYLLHQGEAVVPSNRNQQNKSQSITYNPTINISIDNGNNINPKELAKEIDRQMQTEMRRRTGQFGGL